MKKSGGNLVIYSIGKDGKDDGGNSLGLGKTRRRRHVYDSGGAAREESEVRDLMPSKPLLVLGTGNRKKGAELAKLLAPAGLEIRTLADFPNAAEVVEDGDTFAANAILKAGQQAVRLGCWVAADDSGLAVDALGGAPGVLSARYSGPQATDEANNRLLLEELSGVPSERRGAQFVCHVALSDPAGEIRARERGVLSWPDSLHAARSQRLWLRPAVRDRRVSSQLRRVERFGQVAFKSSRPRDPPPVAKVDGDGNRKG